MASLYNTGNLEAIALLDGERTLSYGEMLDQANNVATHAQKRTLVVFIATNTIDSLVGYVGFLQNGIVPLMVGDAIDEKSFERILWSFKPEYVWCSKSFFYEGRAIAEYGDYRLFETGLNSGLGMHPELALLLTTSGSTGSQKYVRLSYKNIKSNASSIVQYLGIMRCDRAITTLPFSYSYGISIINSHLLAGASLILTDAGLFDRRFWSLLNEYHASTFGGVPYTYSMLKRLHFEHMELPSLRYITQAGGRLGEVLHEEFARICADKGIDFVVMYGQTEGTARLSYLPSSQSLEKIGSIGMAIPGGRFYLIDDDGRQIFEPGVTGELFYEGENVSMGYASNRDNLLLGDERKGRLATGDYAQFDEDGFYRIVGRKKRFLKIFGNRVNLDEVEAILSEFGFMTACVGSDDNMVVFLEKGDANEALQCLTVKTGLNKTAFRVSRIAALPRNDSGKILYSELEERC